jgi:ferredoxin-NADP reductase
MSRRIQLRIKDKIRETDRTSTLILEPVDTEVTYRPGQFITLIFDELGPVQVRRSYSLSSAPEVDKLLSITVKKVPNGAVSRYLVDTAPPGDILQALPPAGRFTTPPQWDYPRDIFLIGGGSGVTPLFSLLRYFLHKEPQSRITLINANRDEHHLIFREQLRVLAENYAMQFNPVFYLSSPRAPFATLRQQLAPITLRWGRLSNALIEELVLRHQKYYPEHAQFFICGPQGLLIKAENTLGFMGYSDQQVHREIFTVRTVFRPDADRFPLSQVRLHLNGDHYQFPVEPGQHILEAAQRAGIELPYSCLSGICTTCSAQCRLGEVEMYTQEGRLDTRSTDGLVLTCVGYPRTPIVELDAEWRK